MRAVYAEPDRTWDRNNAILKKTVRLLARIGSDARTERRHHEPPDPSTDDTIYRIYSKSLRPWRPPPSVDPSVTVGWLVMLRIAYAINVTRTQTPARTRHHQRRYGRRLGACQPQYGATLPTHSSNHLLYVPAHTRLGRCSSSFVASLSGLMSGCHLGMHLRLVRVLPSGLGGF
jgi:hypothetical protein